MNYLRSVFGKTQIKLAIIGAASLLLAFIVTLIGKHVVKGLYAENLAKRWSKDNDFSQISCFFSEMSGFSGDNIKELEFNIADQLKKDSLTAKNEDARLWIYAYSANGSAVVSTERETEEFKAVGVGGDFFLFHPLNLVDGNFFSESTLNDDRIVIDRDVAWRLFGSTDVVGRIVEISGQRHIIVGVIEREKGRINDLAGNNVPTVYMSYSSLNRNGQITYLNMYEALLPNPVAGYAKKLIEEKIPVGEESREIVENTGRFHWTKLIMNVKNFGIRGMNGKAIVYPYWENIARGVEDYLTPVAVLGFLLYLFPAVLVLLLLFRLWKKRTIHKDDIKKFLSDRFEEYKEKRRKVKNGEIYE